MSLYSDLNEVLTPYAQRIKELAQENTELKADINENGLHSTTLTVTIETPGAYYSEDYISTKTTKTAGSWGITNFIDVSGLSYIKYQGVRNPGVAPCSVFFNANINDII